MFIELFCLMALKSLTGDLPHVETKVKKYYLIIV